ncbi:MAG: hypothetical protein FJX53_00895 [Alphaproteobacteria bacterium]|nr:hypothetical protein [Alphaproteobacteria bacterium]
MAADDAAALEEALVQSPVLTARCGIMSAQRAAVVRELARASLPLPASTHALEERLAAALARPRPRRFGRRATAMTGLALFAAGWVVAHAGDIADIGKEVLTRLALPDWVEEAIDAHGTAVAANLDLRLLVATDPDQLAYTLARNVAHLLPPHFDAHDSTLLLVGAQIVPWDGGSAINVLHRTPDSRAVTLFVAAVEGPDELELNVATIGGLTLVYWRSDNYAYTLSGEMPAERLVYSAHLLAATDSH